MSLKLKRAACLVMIGWILAIPMKSQTAEPTVENLTWLAGDWRMLKDGRMVDEQWMAPAGGVMLGMSRTVAKGKVIEYEFMQIRTGPGGKLFFIAQPFGRAESAFQVLSVSEGEIVFENKEHDFPQRITYARRSDGSVTATIEGPTNTGHTRRVEFVYKRPSS